MPDGGGAGPALKASVLPPPGRSYVGTTDGNAGGGT